MDIVLALLRTLIFVVATVAVTVYVGRRIGRGHALLWAGTTLLVLHWLIGFGWTTYRAGAPDTTPDVAGWVSWSGYLLPFLAALAFVWGIGQAAGVPARGGAVHGAATAAGPARDAGVGATPPYEPASTEGASARPGPSPVTGSIGAVPAAGGGTGSVVGPRPAPASAGRTPGAHTPSQPHRHKPARPPGLIVPHAVPVVMTPSASHHSPPDPDPVVDLGPEEDASPDLAVPPPGTPPIAPAGWAPVGPRPASSPAVPASPEDGSAQSPVGGRPLS